MGLRSVALTFVWLLILRSFAYATITIGGNVVTQAGNPAEYGALATNGTRAEIFHNMEIHGHVFAFASVAHAAKHYTVREQIIAAMQSTPTWFGYGIPKPTFATGWEGIASTRSPYDMRAKPGSFASAAAALTGLRAGMTASECRTGMHACLLVGHHLGMGSAWINGVYTPTIEIDGRFTGLTVGGNGLTIPGDFIYMKNKDDYIEEAHKKKPGKPAYPHAAWQGENCVYIGGGRVSGLGELSRTEAEMRERLRQAYEAHTGNTLGYPAANTAIRWTAHEFIKIQPP